MLGARRRAWGVAARCQSPTNRACSIRTIFSERSPSQQRLLQTTAHRPHVAIGTPFGRVTRRSLHAVVSEEPLAPLPSAQKVIEPECSLAGGVRNSVGVGVGCFMLPVSLAKGGFERQGRPASSAQPNTSGAIAAGNQLPREHDGPAS